MHKKNGQSVIQEEVKGRWLLHKIIRIRLSLINTLMKDEAFSEGQPRHRQQTLSMTKSGL